eukprot:CCRYP_021240-RA/>CCRYP_021240-RA protein AED:0.01 eAED:0.01 QI:286/1/1/1/1/1/2/602/897
MMVSEASGGAEVSVVPPSSSNKNGTASANAKSNSTVKGGKMSVSDFVSSSFARFEAEYGPSLVEVSAGSEASRLLASRHNKNNNGNTATKGSIGEDNNTDNEGSTADEEDEEEPFWSLLLTLYLPLLLFGLRRSTFGTFSFLRTFLLGHVLRFLISFILFSIPTSFSERFDKWWGHVVQIYWVQHVLWAITGEDRFHPHYHNHHLHNSGSISHYQCCNEGNSSGALSVGAMPVNSASRRGFNPDHVWPPPGLTLLTLITVVAFVVHPDGLTWIMLGKLVDGVAYVLQLISFGLVMLRDEPIYTIAAAASLFGLVLLGGVIHRTLSSKTQRNASQAEDGGVSSSSRKTKKGKKGKSGRHGHHNTSRGRGKVRGGHFRSAKDLYDSPTRHRSRSRSLPRSEEDTHKNECKASQAADDSVSNDFDGSNPLPKASARESRDSVVSLDSQTSPFLSQNSLSKLRPYSVDSSLPQLSDDVSSCSSIAGSLIEVPGSKPLKCVLEDADNNLNRRKSKHSAKRDKIPATSGTQSPAPQSSATRAPPGFIANDLTMTPSRVSPLTVSNPSSSPYKISGSSSISPIRKAVSRPTPPTAKTSYDGSHSVQHASRTRARTTDGIIKHPYSAPLSQNVIASAKSPVHFQSPSLNQPPGIVRYGLPDYSAYAQSDNRYDPRKIELAAFLARVGLVGSACADLLRDIFDVDALAALTPEQLFAYSIGSEKQMEIAVLLKARQLSLQQQQQMRHVPQSHHKLKAASTSVIRPPPGLGFTCTAAASEPGVAALPNAPVSPTTRPLSQARSFAPDSSSRFLLSSPVSSTYGGDGSSKFTLQSLRSTANNSMLTGQVTDLLMQGSFCHNSSPLPLPIGSRLLSSIDRSEPLQTDDEKIDADLRQLGDRMVGSILDF